MKKLLSAAAAAALLSTAGVAHADNISLSTETTTVPAVTITLPFIGTITLVPAIPGATYSQFGLNQGNTELSTPVVTNTWTIKGDVAKDCSYYGGSSTAHTLDFGTIGVNQSNGAAVNNAFDMLSPAVANVNTTTAGCNTNNTVEISKANGTAGLLNSAAGGYDSNEFQANIPYTVNANWQGTTNQGAGQAGSGQSLTVGDNEGADDWSGGAWRSYFNMLITAGTPSKALVAGHYEDTLTVTLTAQ